MLVFGAVVELYVRGGGWLRVAWWKAAVVGQWSVRIESMDAIELFQQLELEWIGIGKGERTYTYYKIGRLREI